MDEKARVEGDQLRLWKDVRLSLWKGVRRSLCKGVRLSLCKDVRLLYGLKGRE